MEAILRLARHRPLSKRVQNGDERLAFHFLFVWESGRRQDFVRASLDSFVEGLRMSTQQRGAPRVPPGEKPGLPPAPDAEVRGALAAVVKT